MDLVALDIQLPREVPAPVEIRRPEPAVPELATA